MSRIVRRSSFKRLNSKESERNLLLENNGWSPQFQTPNTKWSENHRNRIIISGPKRSRIKKRLIEILKTELDYKHVCIKRLPISGNYVVTAQKKDHTIAAEACIVSRRKFPSRPPKWQLIVPFSLPGSFAIKSKVA